jgi:hypothetical protein
LNSLDILMSPSFQPFFQSWEQKKLRNIRNHSPNSALSRPRRHSSQQHTWRGLPFTARRTVGCQVHPATSFLGFSLSSRTYSDDSHHSKHVMPASYSAVAALVHCSWAIFSLENTKIFSQFVPFTVKQ